MREKDFTIVRLFYTKAWLLQMNCQKFSFINFEKMEVYKNRIKIIHVNRETKLFKSNI